MMSTMQCQINRAINTAIAERVILEIQNLVSQCHPQETGTLRPVRPLIVKRILK